jgi:hypothetical protein
VIGPVEIGNVVGEAIGAGMVISSMDKHFEQGERSAMLLANHLVKMRVLGRLRRV